ncbi:MAG: methyltransferase domain-containing protein [Acidimicrobiia bacterium]
MDDPTAEGYFASRLSLNPRRAVLWATLCSSVFQRYVPPLGSVVELGAARGDFINNIRAGRRIAVDVWPGLTEHVAPGVEAHVRSATDLGFLDANSVDVVFASNLVEHLQKDEVRAMLKEVDRVLRSGGRLILVQPNYRTSYKRYFDDYTHVSVWSDVSLGDFLSAEGFKVERLESRFLPLTVNSRIPVHPWLIRLYLASPVKPLAGQMLVVARIV